MTHLKIAIPGDGAANPFTIPGTARKYSCASGSSIQIPAGDADMLSSHGWIAIGGGVISSAGGTSQRPRAPMRNQIFLDFDLGEIVAWAGPVAGWVDITGASV